MELVAGNPGNNGGLYVLGTLTTDASGEGNDHFDFDPSTVSWVGDDGTPALDTQHWAHLDFENPVSVGGFNVYGAAPDPTLGIPFTFWS